MPEEKQLPATTDGQQDVAEFDLSTLSGVEKSAILLLSLTEEAAAEVLKQLEPKMVQRVGAEMASMEDFTQPRVKAVHKKFLEQVREYTTIGLGSEDFVRRALAGALGEDRANNLVDQIMVGGGARGLDALKWMDSRQVASIIRNEHPQIQTIVLAYLDPEQSSEILSQFPEKVRLDLMMRIASLDEVHPAALQELNEIMEKQFAGQAGAQAAKMGGLKTAANIMNYLETGVEGQLMEMIRDTDEELSMKISELMFVFENLIDVDDRGVQKLLSEVDNQTLQVALKGAEEAVREKFLNNMSKRASEAFVDDLEAMGPVRVSDMEAAQKEILSTARRLADAGEIMLGGGGDDFV